MTIIPKTERIHTVYDRLRAVGAVESKQDFAEAVGTRFQTMSSALNGNEKYITTSLMSKVLAAYPSVRRKFLFDGEGPVLGEYFDETRGETVNTEEESEIPKAHTYSVNVERLLESLKTQQDLTATAQRQTDKAQEQIDRMIAIIEQLTQTQTQTQK